MQKETMSKIMRFVTGGVIGLTYIILTKPRKEIISAEDAWARELGEGRMGYLCGRTKAWEKTYRETEDQEFNSKIATILHLYKLKVYLVVWIVRSLTNKYKRLEKSGLLYFCITQELHT